MAAVFTNMSLLITDLGTGDALIRQQGEDKSLESSVFWLNIAIGCIIKGKTLNFNLISEAITNGIMQISINEKKPIGNAVLTCFNINQAKNRINRSLEAANAVVAVLKNGPKKI